MIMHKIYQPSIFQALQSDYYLSCVTVSAVFHQPDPLPSSQGQLPIRYGNVDRCSTQYAFDVCWHIVRSLVIVLIETFPFWY